MNKITTLFLMLIAVFTFILGTAMQSKAQNKTFAGVIPFMSASDRLGFLDQNTGRVYMYDSNFSQCLFVGQLQNLGQPIQIIKKS
jgi:hypothetical protein